MSNKILSKTRSLCPANMNASMRIPSGPMTHDKRSCNNVCASGFFRLYGSFVAFDDHSTRSRQRHSFTRWLLQRSLCWGTEDQNRQAATGVSNTSPHVSSMVAVVCRDFCTPSFIGSMFQYKLSVLLYRCQQNQAPRCLAPLGPCTI